MEGHSGFQSKGMIWLIYHANSPTDDYRVLMPAELLTMAILFIIYMYN